MVGLIEEKKIVNKYNLLYHLIYLYNKNLNRVDLMAAF